MKRDKDCIQQVTVLEATWSNIPEDVKEEIGTLWEDRQLGNDYYYCPWSEEMDETYPKIAAYLKKRGVKECLIHLWW